MREIMTFPRDYHYRLTIAMWACDVCTFTGSLMEKNHKVSLDVIREISVLTIAIVLYWLKHSNS